MKTTILTVGTEILFGQIVNTNAAYLSRQLNDLGFDVMYHYSVGDNPGRLAEMIHMAFKDCDMIITTGGLGPTQDDLTKETIAGAVGTKLVLSETALDALKNHYEKSKRPMTENNLKQAIDVIRNNISKIPDKDTLIIGAMHPSKANLVKSGTYDEFFINSKGKTIKKTSDILNRENIFLQLEGNDKIQGFYMNPDENPKTLASWFMDTFNYFKNSFLEKS